jgi:hypothetical protein
MPESAARTSRRRTLRPGRVPAALSSDLVSVAGVVGGRVRNQSGAEIGRVVDVVVRWRGEHYPPVTGLVTRVGRREAWLPIGQVDDISGRLVTLRSARFDLRDVVARPGEVMLHRDVIDHQMVDVDEVRVFRAADLYLARVSGSFLLVGADVGVGSLVRRLGPARWRARPTPERVIDWAAIQPFSDGRGPVRMLRPNEELDRLRPGELADLLEELGRRERQELLGVLQPERAADALEEMESDHLRNLLRELSPTQTAALVADMEPDEAAEALRDLDVGTRDALLDDMAPQDAQRLRTLLSYPDRTAGGLMTLTLVSFPRTARVADVRRRLLAADDRDDVDGVVVVDDDGVLVDDVQLIDLFLADPGDTIGDLVRASEPVTVEPGAPLDEAIDALVGTRSRSLVVTDADGRPLGRILADDIVDALVPDRGRIRFPRLG